MKRTTKISLTLTYEEWVTMLRACNMALGEMKDPPRHGAELVMARVEIRPVRDALTKRLAERVAKGGGIRS